MQAAIGSICLATTPMAGAGITVAETRHAMGFNATTWQCCAIDEGQQRADWRIETDASMPLAIVCDHDTPAGYAPGHVRVRLVPDGPVDRTEFRAPGHDGARGFYSGQRRLPDTHRNQKWLEVANLNPRSESMSSPHALYR